MQNDGKILKMIETLANGYSYESAQRELSYEYQQDRVWMIFRNLSILVIWTKVASALEGLTYLIIVSPDQLRGAEDVVQTFLQHLSVLLVGQDTEH